MRHAPAAPWAPAAYVLGLTLAAPALRAQPPAPRAFVVRRGADTLVVERLEQGADGTLTSRFTTRGGGLPIGARVVTTYTPAPEGRVRRAVTEATAPGATTPAPRVVLTFGAAPGDSVDVQVGAEAPRRVAAAPNVIPFGDLSVAPWELVLRRALALGGGTLRTATVPIFTGPGRPALAVTVAPQGRDSVVFTLNAVEVRARVSRDGRVLGMRVPAQNVTFDAADPRAVSALPAPAAPAPPSYAPPAGAPYAAEDVRVPTPGGFALAGTLTRPSAARGPVPVVVTITGSGPQERDERLAGITGYALFRQIADTLGRRGIGVLRLDDRGVGASGGTFATATSRDFADDVRAALAWLRARGAERGDVDARRLALLGHSEGGLIAPMVAADDPAVAALVLMAGPAYTGRRVLTYQLRRDVVADTTLAPARRDSLLAVADRTRDSVLAGTAWMRFFDAYDPLATARRVRAPVLVLQGATDRQVTPEQADTLAAALRAGGDRDVTVRVFPDTDHLFLADPSGAPAGYAALPSKAVRPEVLGAVADWLAARLAPDAPR
ncbi:hypothetical protein tb265_08640 [Gemmatimonadetes bacterium T265]|nr:hypothetical protein tb265_08640 [Gemmatimonadetes bacterium T265]